MKPPKIQRWIDLLAALLRRHFPVSFEELIREVPAYGSDQSDEARRRMFERDKDELRAFGIPIETRAAPDEGEVVGYRLRPATSTCRTSPLRAEGRSARPSPGSSTGTATRRSRRSPSSPRSWPPWPMPRPASASSAIRSSPSTPIRPCGSWRATCRWTSAAPAQPRWCRPGPRPRPSCSRTLGDALERRKRVTFGYRTMGSDAHRQPHGRAVRALLPEPALVPRRPRPPGEETVKNYRLSRIADAEVNAEAARHAGLRDPRRLRPARARPLPPGMGARRRRRGRRPSSRFRTRSGAAAAARGWAKRSRAPPTGAASGSAARRLRPLAALLRRRPGAGLPRARSSTSTRPGPRNAGPSRAPDRRPPTAARHAR